MYKLGFLAVKVLILVIVESASAMKGNSKEPIYPNNNNSFI